MTTAAPFGLDLFNDGDLDPLMRETEGEETLILALARRLDTARGTLIDDKHYGLALVDLLSQAQTPEGLDSIPSTIALELEKDERVQRGSMRGRLASFDGKTMVVELSGRAAGGPFQLTVEIDKVGTKLLSSSGGG